MYSTAQVFPSLFFLISNEILDVSIILFLSIILCAEIKKQFKNSTTMKVSQNGLFWFSKFGAGGGPEITLTLTSVISEQANTDW